jgi:hypothetical protein
MSNIEYFNATNTEGKIEETIDPNDPRQMIWREMVLNLMTPSVRKQWLRTEAELLKLHEEHQKEDAAEDKTVSSIVPSFPEESLSDVKIE